MAKKNPHKTGLEKGNVKMRRKVGRPQIIPDIPMFRKNTAAFVHEMPATAVSNVDGDGNYVRGQVLTNAGALDRDKQVALVDKMTGLIATAANDPELKTRTWVLLTEAAPGGWGLWGHAQTNDELVKAARAEMGR